MNATDDCDGSGARRSRFAASAGAYEAVAVTDGGSLSGQVKFAGAAPAPEKFEVTKDPEACGKEKTKPDLIVGSGGGIANVVVVVKAAKGKKLAVPADAGPFDQKGCEFQPHVLAFPAGSTDRVLNPRRRAAQRPHDEQGEPRGQQGACRSSRSKIGLEDREGRVADRRQVRRAPWMHAYWLSMDHPYYAVTDADGSFKIADLPAGDYEVEVWHEKLGKKTEKVTVKARRTRRSPGR